MAKEAKKSPAAEATKADAAVAEAKPIKKVNPSTLGSVELVPFKPNQVQAFGNNYMVALVAQAGLEEDAQKALADASKAKIFLSFEMTKAIFTLAHKSKGTKNEIDVFAIFSNDIAVVERLNKRVLIEMGVMKRVMNDDTDRAEYVWTNPDVEKLYSYTAELKDKDLPEWTRRNNNRKRLNLRISEACKAASTLMDYKCSPEDLFYSEGEGGEMVPTIKNAPKQIGGDAGVVQMNVRKPVKGATLSPTMSSLVKISTDRHKEPAKPRGDEGEKREEEKMGMTDEAFGSIVNSVKRAVMKQENIFTPEMQKHITSLYTQLGETMKTWIIKKPEATNADKAAEAVA